MNGSQKRDGAGWTRLAPPGDGTRMEWRANSWRSKPVAQAVAWDDPARLRQVGDVLAASPPLVSAADAARLRAAMAQVAAGEALLLQGGDCAETFGSSRAETALPTLRLLEALAAELVETSGRDVVRVARMAGQFAKPRSAEAETQDGDTLPSWRGDMVNSADFSLAARTPDPARLLAGYRESATTLEAMRHAAPGIFTSHEALLLDYEEALTREVDGEVWCLSAHMLWIGERTRQLDGAHVEYARGIANTIGLKCGPEIDAATLLALIERLDPANEPGRLVLITRMGAERAGEILPSLMQAVKAEGRNVAWVCDPMHGNTRREGALKRRNMDDILGEVRAFVAAANEAGAVPGGLHLEMTGAEVVECDSDDQDADHFPLCDPRLNAGQAGMVVSAFSNTSLTAERSGPLRGSATVPGDKSISHRALILAGLAEGESRLTGLADGQDVARTRRAIEALGAETIQDGEALVVRGAHWHSPEAVIDCGNAGTAARLLLGAAAGSQIGARFDGDESLRRRPMEHLLTPLRTMGARIAGSSLPLALAPARLGGVGHTNLAASAQVKAGLLLAGLGAEGRTEVIERRPTRDHLERMLPAFGVPVERSKDSIAITGPVRPRAANIHVPGDFSSAAFPLVAALLVPGSEITLTGVGLNPLRTGLLETLAEMGADLRIARRDGIEPDGDIVARTSNLRAVTVPAERAPRMIDEYPILAIAAACASGETIMQGVGALRHKESDRIAALVEGLTACGVQARAEHDNLIVRGGGVAGGGTVDTRGDHRIAMAFLVLGLVSEAPITVTDAQMIATSFPTFAATMRLLGALIA